MSSKLTFRRFMAFIIDIIIVSFIVGAFSSLKILNPTLDKYNESYDKYVEYVNNIAINGDSNKILSDKDALDMSYDVSYYGVYSSIISLIVLTLYFGVFQYYTGGKTIGKLLFRLKVESKSGKLKLTQVLLRSAIINSLITKLLMILCIIFMKKSMYLSTSLIIQIIDIIIILTSVIFIVYRDDGVGLHDMLAKTIVVKSNNKSIIKEAIYKEK